MIVVNMLTGEAKKAYQREYIKRYRSNKKSVRPNGGNEAKSVRPVRPDDVRPSKTHVRPDKLNYTIMNTLGILSLPLNDAREEPVRPDVRPAVQPDKKELIKKKLEAVGLKLDGQMITKRVIPEPQPAHCEPKIIKVPELDADGNMMPEY